MRNDCGNCAFAAMCRQYSCPASRPSPWYETPEEVEALLAWGDRKAYLMRWVRRHMGRMLSRRQQMVVELCLFRGMTFSQIARMTGVNRSAVCRAMKRSVVRLRRLWQAQQTAGNTRPRVKKRGGKCPPRT